MTKNGNGYNGKYTAQQFIDAIPGTGGVVSLVAERVGCAWHTARKYIDEYATVNRAWQNERNYITDLARGNIIDVIKNDKDLQTSKWWVKVMDEEFRPPVRQEITGRSGGAIKLENVIRIVIHDDEDTNGNGA